mmetsp:Transcript_8128/g.10722  ORF Transcript_8128/g.10722 Transcript_8128/m.10722 type:complete len:80 (-) Transcript_8128:126-365(-)
MQNGDKLFSQPDDFLLYLNKNGLKIRPSHSDKRYHLTTLRHPAAVRKKSSLRISCSSTFSSCGIAILVMLSLKYLVFPY